MVFKYCQWSIKAGLCGCGTVMTAVVYIRFLTSACVGALKGSGERVVMVVPVRHQVNSVRVIKF